MSFFFFVFKTCWHYKMVLCIFWTIRTSWIESKIAPLVPFNVIVQECNTKHVWMNQFLLNVDPKKSNAEKWLIYKLTRPKLVETDKKCNWTQQQPLISGAGWRLCVRCVSVSHEREFCGYWIHGPLCDAQPYHFRFKWYNLKDEAAFIPKCQRIYDHLLSVKWQMCYHRQWTNSIKITA